MRARRLLPPTPAAGSLEHSGGSGARSPRRADLAAAAPLCRETKGPVSGVATPFIHIRPASHQGAGPRCTRPLSQLPQRRDARAAAMKLLRPPPASQRPARPTMVARIDSAEELHGPCTCAPVQRKGGLPRPLLLAERAPSRRVLMRSSSADSAEGGGDNPAAAARAAAARDASEPLSRGRRPDSGWGALTDRLVGLSTLPFIFLFLPQARWAAGVAVCCLCARASLDCRCCRSSPISAPPCSPAPRLLAPLVLGSCSC